MKIAYFDTIGGISGDMTLAAFISAGLPLDDLREAIAGLGIEGVELEASHLSRNGIDAVKLDVIIPDGPMPHRRLEDVYEIIDKSSLSGRVKKTARDIFLEVAKAEAKVHNSAVERVHFHEVGAIDSIVDIVGAAFCLQAFVIDAVHSSPVRLGSGGFVETAHGKLPLPAPAALEILRGYPVTLTDIPFELTTPTGAAILKATSAGVLTAERLTVDAIGYGAGSREIPQLPNVLRLMIGHIASEGEGDEIVGVEANIDDMNPELYPFVLEQLFAAGALDAYCVPLIMKKGRPGMLLSALASRGDLEKVVSIYFSQTSTIGVRMHAMERRKLMRELRKVQTRFGLMKVKVILHDGRERLVPEYEECRRVAQETGIPLQDVYRALEGEFGS